LDYGANYLVEFDAPSLWYETSLTIAADSLKNGIRTDYHTFTHSPADVRSALMRLGLDLDVLESDDTFRMWDSYTQQTRMGEPEKVGKATPRDPKDIHTLDLKRWTEEDVVEPQRGIHEVDSRRLHIDDDTSILLHFNDEKTFINHFRMHALPFARIHQLALVHSVVKSVFSETFYKQFESFCDGVLDFRTEEKGASVEHSMRVRLMRGKQHYSAWQRLRLLNDGKVAMVDEAKPGEAQGRKLAAIMFTDVVGYAEIAQKDEPLAIELLNEQRRIVRAAVRQRGGTEVKTMGDGFLVEFASAIEAAKCAIEIQKTLQQRNASSEPDRQVLLRIGIHVGDILEDGNDIVGDGVNVASRIEPLASPGGICVSQQVFDHIRNKLDAEIVRLGPRELKHLDEPVEVYEIVVGGAKAAPRTAQLKRHRLAVLPLANIGSSSEDEYLADGLTEELISILSRIAGLSVIARTSVMRYKGASKGVADIGRELNVETVVEGSVRRLGGTLRITAKLVDARTEESLWSQQYDRSLDDVFSIQTDIAHQTAEALNLEILVRERQGIERRSTRSTDAYQSYLKGRYNWNQRNKEALDKAAGYFRQSLEKDPGYATAYAGLADTYAVLALLEFVAPRDAYPEAKKMVEKALAIDGGLAEAHTSLALIRFQYDWDWPGSEKEFKRAIELNANYAPAHHFYADMLKAQGRFDEAMQQIGLAQELDPLSLAISTGVGHVLYLSRRYDDSIRQYARTVELDPNFMQTHLWFGRPYLQKGMYSEAIAELQKAVSLSGESTVALAMLGHALASAGKKDEADKVMQKLVERSKTTYVPSYWIAVVYNGFRDRENVLAWLEKAYDERSSWLAWVKVEPRFDWLRGDPAFDSIVRRLGL
jgi:class 3 adenylate cyclase/tetratricopeptide (TPR) repeat protein